MRTHQQCNSQSCRDTSYTKPLPASSSSPQQLQEHSNGSPLPPTLTPVSALSLPCSPKQRCKRGCPLTLPTGASCWVPSLSLHPSALWMLSLLLKCFLFIQCSAVSIPLPQEAFLGCSQGYLVTPYGSTHYWPSPLQTQRHRQDPEPLQLQT